MTGIFGLLLPRDVQCYHCKAFSRELLSFKHRSETRKHRYFYEKSSGEWVCEECVDVGSKQYNKREREK